MVINFHVVICDIPINPTPTSSGSGDAIIIAPITGKVQLKYFVWIRCFSLSDPKYWKKCLTSSTNPLVLINWNIVVSPITAPTPAIKAISKGLRCSARLNKITVAIETVNVETKREENVDHNIGKKRCYNTLNNNF